MDLVALYQANPFWWWVAAGLLFLAVEVATGTETLLWPAASAGVVAILVGVGIRLPLGLDLGLFALLTIVSALLARRFMRRPAAGPDINDPGQRIVGQRGLAVGSFDQGRGRVAVEGKEWAAEAEVDATIAPDARVEVVQVLDGGRLRVRAI